MTEKCPVCKKPTNIEFTPFCSKHCKNVDLLHWLNEDYRVPTDEPVLDADEKKETEDDH